MTKMTFFLMILSLMIQQWLDASESVASLPAVRNARSVASQNASFPADESSGSWIQSFRNLRVIL